MRDKDGTLEFYRCIRITGIGRIVDTCFATTYRRCDIILQEMVPISTRSDWAYAIALRGI